ncbi:MAG: site-specific DNA-methyltransferase [Magnetococcales bacterium]|nr:site-specific DNA-methyltransferase [Magnetococcales bacterium]
MHKMTADDPLSKSADLLAENIEKLKSLFPELLTEGPQGVSVNVDVLKGLVGDATVSDGEEKYGLNWHGKRLARQIALTPSTGTLRPCPEESVDWDNTQHLMIEGDNLEVLKLLQKSYAGKVKLIYIDPPYNTGKDFVYPDDFRDNIRNYLELTGQVDGEGRKISSNTEASGRFHTDWLNMMYPRLKIARSLLSSNGFCIISCDDGEAAHLRLLMNDLFGEENFIAQFVWKARKFTDTRAITNISTDHEYIIAYSRTPEVNFRGTERDESKFENPDNDPRGDWMSRSILGLANKQQRPNLHYDIIEPGNGRIFPPKEDTGWRYSQEKMQELIRDKRILFPQKETGRPREKKFRSEMQSEFISFRSIIDDIHTANGTEELRELMSSNLFSFPKPTELIVKIINQTTNENDLMLDFFSGSGTSSHAVWIQNNNDSYKRRFIAIQLPEPIPHQEYPTIADFCKERLRRAGAKIKRENPLFSGDTGFRVFKLDTSNIRPWQPLREDLAGSLLAHTEHLVDGRSEQDILFELLLKLGLELTVPIDQKIFAGKTVYSIGLGALMVCLDQHIRRNEVEPLAQGILAWWQELDPAVAIQFVFRDSGFADDVAKTNLATILEQNIPAKRLAGIRSI